MRNARQKGRAPIRIELDHSIRQIPITTPWRLSLPDNLIYFAQERSDLPVVEAVPEFLVDVERADERRDEVGDRQTHDEEVEHAPEEEFIHYNCYNSEKNAVVKIKK